MSASPAEPDAGYSVETVRTESAFLSLRDDWRRLYESSQRLHVYSSYEWVWAWWRSIGSADSAAQRCRLNVLVVRRGNRITGIAPLMMRVVARAGIKIRKVEFIDVGLGDYRDFLLEADSSRQLEVILHHLLAEEDTWDLVDLRNFSLRSNTPRILEQLLAQSGTHYRVERDERCPYFPIETDWSGILQTRSKATRETFKNQLNRLRRLETEGLRLRIIENPQQEPDLLQKMVALERRKRVRDSPNLYVLSRTAEFLDNLLQTLGPQGKIAVAVMEKANQLVAHELFFLSAGSILCCAKAFDPDYARLSPGNLLMAAVVDFGYQKGYREYDFLGGEEEYKMRWAKGVHETLRLKIWTPRLRSRIAALLYFDVKPRLDRWVSRYNGGQE